MTRRVRDSLRFPILRTLETMRWCGTANLQVGLAVDARGDVALAGHMFEKDEGVGGRKDAVVMKLASSDGYTLWTR